LKTLILAVVAPATILAAPAMAADMFVKAKAPPPPVVIDWSGIYVGGSIGGVWTDAHRFMPNLPQVGIPAQTFTSHGNDTIYDVHVGLQWQWQQWVLGVEGGYSQGAKGIGSSVSVSPPEPFTSLAATTHLTELFTVGPRVGYAWDRVMAYGTGGYALERINGSYTCKDTGLPVLPGPGACSAVFGPAAQLDFGGVTFNNGWFAGFGLEVMAWRGPGFDVILGAEYQHFEAEQKLAFQCTVAQCGPTQHQNFLQDVAGNIVRARLSIKTDGWGPFAIR